MHQADQSNRAPGWLAAFGDDRPATGSRPSWDSDRATGSDTRMVAGGRALNLLESPADWSPVLAQGEHCRIIFDGILHNRDELRELVAESLPGDPNDPELVVQAYRCWGKDALRRVKGIFAMVILDIAQDVLLCVRDPLGMHPLFYAEIGRTLLISPSIETLLRHPGVSAEINRARLVDYLARRWTRHDETCFTNIHRVPPGHVLRVDRNGRQAYRYWDPLPPDRPIEWIPDDEAQERFEALLQQAVARRLTTDSSGILLSGGLDSSTIAMVATDLCVREGRTAPWALSLTLPEPYDEEGVGRAVAGDLGMPRLLVPYDQAVGARGVIAAGLDLSGTLPAPMFNVGAPAFMHLSLAARERGCRVIMTGDGGDEWLGMSPDLAANMLGPMNLVGIFRLWRTLSRYYDSVRWASLRGVLWQFGVRPFLQNVWRTSAEAARGLRSWRGGVAPRTVPWIAAEPWIAPDPLLRAQLVRRVDGTPRDSMLARGAESAYRRIFRSSLDAPHLGLRAEEAFLLGRHTGVRQQDPFWDADLIDLMVRIRPHIRSKGGVSKALVRGVLSRRFPLRSFESQRKSPSRLIFIQSVILAEAAKASRELGDRWVLGDLGVIDPRQVRAFLDNPPEGKGWRVWDLLNLETWVRAHYRSGG